LLQTIVQAKLGNVPKAVEFAESAEEISPEDVSILNFLGVVLHGSGKNQESMQAFEKL